MTINNGRTQETARIAINNNLSNNMNHKIKQQEQSSKDLQSTKNISAAKEKPHHYAGPLNGGPRDMSGQL